MPDEMPALQRNTTEPKGSLNSRFRMIAAFGLIAIAIVALSIVALRKPPVVKPPAQPSAAVTGGNSLALTKNFNDAVRQGEGEGAPAAPFAPPPSLPNTAAYPQQPQPQQQPQQVSPEEQERQEIARAERQRAYSARVASNIFYVRGPQQQPQQPEMAQQPQPEMGRAPEAPAMPYRGSAVPASQAPAATDAEGGMDAYKRPPEVDLNRAHGAPRIVPANTIIAATLMPRVSGDAPSKVWAIVSEPVLTHDLQHVLIPQGTLLSGESRVLGSQGIGQQRPIAVAFHRMRMPDLYSVDLDQYKALSQIGQMGLKDKVDNHYGKIFGASIVLALISAANESTISGGQITGNGADALRYGASNELSSEGGAVLDRFLRIPPSLTIREGNRLKVYVEQDLLLPTYKNHDMPTDF